MNWNLKGLSLRLNNLDRMRRALECMRRRRWGNCPGVGNKVGVLRHQVDRRGKKSDCNYILQEDQRLGVYGNFGLPGETNEDGVDLIDWCEGANLSYANSYSDHC